MPKVVNYPKVPDNFTQNIYVKLCWFKKQGASLVGEECIKLVTLQDLQDIFNVYIDNAHLNYFHIKTRHVRLIQRLTDHRISIHKFMYFIEQKSYFDIPPLSGVSSSIAS